MEREAWGQTGEEVLRSLESGYSGLNTEQISKRRVTYGKNIPVEEKEHPVIIIFFRQFKSFILYVLMFAAVVSYLSGNHLECTVVSSLVGAVVLIGFIEELKATRDMKSLKKLTPKTARAIRNGIKIELLAEELVPGDIILLSRGDLVPADARILTQASLRVDESAMTGESIAIGKNEKVVNEAKMIADQNNMVFAGTHVMNGEATCVVTTTGRATEIGKISEMLKSIPEEFTPLQKRVEKLGKQFSTIVLILCAVVFIIGIFRGQPFSEILLLTLALAVAGVPESLPAVIRITLAMGMKRMAKKGAIVKRLPAVETLGTCTVICTDKTGTLTQNKMVIEKIFAFDTEVTVTGQGFAPEGLFIKENVAVKPASHKGLSKVLEIGLLCNNATLKSAEGEWTIDGESTEGALIVMAKKAGFEKEEYHARCPRVQEHPFDPDRKMMSAVHLVKNRPIVYAKGAPEMLLGKSSFYLLNGRIKRLDKRTADAILAKNNEYASHGLRVLGLAYKEHKGKTYEMKHVESSLIFVGLVAMRDPPKEGVKESIKLCTKAGAWIVMITGDNKMTAIAVAKDLGIYDEGDKVLTGPELDRMSQDDFVHVVESVSIYARATPAHKLRIVEALQKQGEIVAMTGDGVNDAPALKRADIGVAMGKRGSDVAKEASEMVLVDDNFATIVVAIKEGRTIYANIRRFIYYVLAGNFSEIMLLTIAAMMGVLPVLTPLMILFINLVTSDVPAIGLCSEEASPNIMNEKPRDPKESILNDYMLLKIMQVIPLITLGTMAIYLWQLTIMDVGLQKAQTMAFATLVFFELFHVFNAKSMQHTVFSKSTFNNPRLLVGYLISVLCLLMIFYWGPAQRLFETLALTAIDWAIVLLTAFTVILVVEIQKTIINSEIRERERAAVSVTRR